MADKFQQMAFTASVRRAQEQYYGKSRLIADAPATDALTGEEISFIEARDSFYMATVSETGWPYVQHRGGPPGFLRSLGPTSLAFADYKGNRQLISTGNLAVTDRVALFLMDYPNQTRLKILGRVRVAEAKAHPELVRQWAEPAAQRLVERLFLIEVVSFDWNCPQHITPRYSAAEIKAAVQPLQERIADLEAQLAARPAR
jgi:predicted pyridoxine 5'-phosphate oxidase superfamily flavin-nucleotide-binding protein